MKTASLIRVVFGEFVIGRLCFVKHLPRKKNEQEEEEEEEEEEEK